VIGDRDVGASERPRGDDHLLERQAAVARRGVHLEVGARRRLPRRIGVERAADLGGREEAAARLVGLGDRRRVLEPGLDPGGDPRADRSELGQGATGLREICGLLDPEPRGSRGAFERAAAMIGLLAAGAPEELAELGVRQHPQSFPPRRGVRPAVAIERASRRDERRVRPGLRASAS
jgi:hypothetical protein